MSQYYTPQRLKNLYDPKENSAKDGQTFKLSRSKIDLFLNCPRCFYYDRRLGVGRPPGFPLSSCQTRGFAFQFTNGRF